MKCLGCYTEVKESYCLPCRKKLFGKSRVASILDVDAPYAGNLVSFQEHSKHLSISGAQLKYAMRLHENKLELTNGGGQYILKPIPPAQHLLNTTYAPENEHLTMQIASQVFKMNVAFNALILFRDNQPAYITRRFDVRPDGTKFLQEDFAQLTNRTRQTHGETFKYDGTYEEIGIMIKRYVAAAMPALEQFFQLVVFNYIMSNGDAHLKNFSLISDGSGEYQLSPAYDLMSTVLHTPHESDTALSLYHGDMESGYYAIYGHYGRENFMELSKRLGLIEKRAERIIDSFQLKLAEMEQMVQHSFLPQELKVTYMKNVIDRLERIALKPV